ncbi:MAG TPA: PHP-associated domain-containing protein, partial [Dehalococcoidia bacterium]|nr:PHP-associated domain-containing protein [Dehalococcoidia bacterium]
IAGTDAHRESNLGYCATAFERPVADMESLLAELRAGRFAPVVGIGRGLCLPFDASSLTQLETMQRDASRRTG